MDRMQAAIRNHDTGLGPRLGATAPPSYPYAPAQQALREALLRELKAGDYEGRPMDCVCGSSDAQPVARWVWLGLESPTVLCTRCGLLRSQAPLAAASSRMLHSRHLLALEGTQDWQQLETREHKAISSVLPALKKQLTDSQRRAVHVGSGAGGGLRALREAGFEAWGVEARLPDGGEHASADLVSLCEELDDPVDLVLVSGALDRSTDLHLDLCALRALVQPGGVLWVESRGLQTVGANYEGDLLRYFRIGEHWHFNEATLRWVVSCVGFSPLSSTPDAQVTARRADNDQTDSDNPPSPQLARDVMQQLAAAEKHILSQGAAPTTPRRPAVAMHPPDRSFFCLGMAKTGTTLLARVIDQHPRVAVTSESYPFTPDNLGSLFNPESGHYRVHGFSNEQVARWHRIWKEAADSETLQDLAQWTGTRFTDLYPFRKTMGEALAAFAARTGATWAGDSWPYYMTKLPVLIQAFPGCKFIYNVRDPRAVWYSGQKWKGRGLGDKIMGDMVAADQLLERARLGARVHVMRYEDLIHEPEATMRAIWEFLGADFKPQYLQYEPSQDPHPNRWQVIANATAGFDPAMTRKWEKHVPSDKRAQIEKVAAAFMQKYGYQ